jgi:hypothetical protein
VKRDARTELVGHNLIVILHDNKDWYYVKRAVCIIRKDQTMSQALSPSILDRLLEPFCNAMPLDYAKEIVELRADPDVQARIDELAEKCNEGQLSEAEREEYESYADAIHLIGILQRQARRVLAIGAHR